MYTKVDVDQKLLEEALELGDQKTRKAVVNEALAEYVRLCKQQKMLELAGSIDFDPDYDYKAAR